MAGSTRVKLEVDDPRRGSRKAGREPAQRTTLYEIPRDLLGRCGRWSSTAAPTAAGRRPPEPQPGPRPGQARGEDLGSAAPTSTLRRRAPGRAEAAAGDGAPDRRRGGAAGEGAERFAVAARVGVPWLGWADGTCRYCRSGAENLWRTRPLHRLRRRRRLREFAIAAEDFCFRFPTSTPTPRRRRSSAPG